MNSSSLNCIRRFVFAAFVAVAAIVALAGCGGPKMDGRPGGPEIVEGGVIFRYHDTDAERVNIVGDFNNWVVRADAMVDKNGDGEWTILLNLAPGRYEYKFVIDGVHWIHDPRNPDAVSDGFEGRNSVIVVPAPGS